MAIVDKCNPELVLRQRNPGANVKIFEYTVMSISDTDWTIDINRQALMLMTGKFEFAWIEKLNANDKLNDICYKIAS